jgi:hypothetical protein
MKSVAVVLVGLLLIPWTLGARPPQTSAPPEIVLRPDLPAGEEWYTPTNKPHVKSPTEKFV